jgi:hypothetical protein
MSSVTRYCPSCGLERREGERFCRNCGAALGTGQTRLHASPVVAPPTTQPLEPVQPPVPTQQQAPTALPPPPGAPQAGGETAAAQRTLPLKPLAVGGGAVLVIAALLPWVSIGGASTNALDVPVQALWDLDAGDGPIKVGFVTIALGLIGGGLSFVPKTAGVRRLCGSIALAIAAAFALQLFRTIDQSGGSFGDLLDVMGVGVYASVVGAIGLQISR